MVEVKRDVYTGFCLGFLTSVVVCLSYWWIAVVYEHQPGPPPLVVYKYSVPEPEGSTRDDIILKYGVPNRGPETLSYINQVVGYDQSRKIPLWVAERITMDAIEGDADRDNCSFKPDMEQIHEMFSATLEDYEGSGYDRGHMSPAANHKYSQEAMCASFYLTNVVPQDSQLNRLYWKELEHHCRVLAKRYQEVRAITGPMFLPELPVSATKDKRFVKYEVIGENNVNVPTHFYKIIMVENATETSNITFFSAAFLFPNQPIDAGIPLKSFKVPLAQLEAAAGLRFFPRLAEAPVGDLCHIDPCRLPSEMDSSLLGRFISGASATAVLLAWAYAMYKWKEHSNMKE